MNWKRFLLGLAVLYGLMFGLVCWIAALLSRYDALPGAFDMADRAIAAGWLGLLWLPVALLVLRPKRVR